MNAALITAGALIFLFLGYRIYGRFLAKNIYRIYGKDNEKVPSKENYDGVDYVPSDKYVLFGHHFASIAGAAPILGPAIAIIWGWVPALIWVVFGTLFMGAVHDFGALVLSVENKGKSIGSLTSSIIGPRSKNLFLAVIFILVFIVLAVFAFLIAKLFILYPGSVIPVNFEIIVAILIGYYINRKKGNLLIPSLLALISLYVVIYIGFQYPVHLPEYLWINNSEILTWISIIFAYGFIASVLPVWILLQPRDYINSHKLITGLAIIYLGIFISQPVMDAPAVAFNNAELSWFPFLFITIACGAISGFHALVSSGTTSKQISSRKDSKLIGYGGMVGEAILAVAATIAVAAGFPSSEEWHAHYSNYDMASGLQASLSAFVEGTASFLTSLGIDQVMYGESGNSSSLAAVFISVMVISFAATSLDTAIRIQRYILGEIGTGLNNPILSRNRYVQSFLAVFLSFLLVITDSGGSGGLILWPLFGSTNQMVGALTLLVISVWLYRKGRNFLPTLIPMAFLTVITFIGTALNIKNYFSDENWLLVSLAAAIGFCQIWILYEAFRIFRSTEIRRQFPKEKE